MGEGSKVIEQGSCLWDHKPFSGAGELSAGCDCLGRLAGASS